MASMQFQLPIVETFFSITLDPRKLAKLQVHSKEHLEVAIIKPFYFYLTQKRQKLQCYLIIILENNV